jgi:hypothetical protein
MNRPIKPKKIKQKGVKDIFFFIAPTAIMSRSKIVVCGDEKCGKKEFLTGLINLSKNPSNIDSEDNVISSSSILETSSSTTSSGYFTRSLILETKYYSASLEFILLPLIEFSTPTSKTKEVLKDAEALIIIANADVLSKDINTISPFFTNCESLLSLLKKKKKELEDDKEIETELETRQELDDDNLCLLFCSNKCDIASGGAIPGADADAEENGGGGSAFQLMTSYGSGSSSDGGSSISISENITKVKNEGLDSSITCQAHSGHSSYLSYARAWCADNGFEHIETCAIKPFVGSRAREKCGIPRVLEALQATMWSTMERKTSNKQTYSTSQTVTREEEIFIKVEGVLDTVLAKDDTTSLPMTTEKVQGDGSDVIEALCRRVDGHEETEIIETSSKPQEKLGELDNLDIGALMQEMRRIRDSAHTGSISDEQRREAAAAMTMRLLAMMGEDTEEDE